MLQGKGMQLVRVASVAAASALLVATVWSAVGAAGAAKTVYRSPYDIRYSPDGKTLAVSDHTAAAVVLIDPAAAKVVGQIALNGEPAGVAWSADGKRLYVAERQAGTVAEVDPAGGKVLRRLPVGPWPTGVALAPKAGVLVVTDGAMDVVSLVDLAAGKEKARVPVPRTPMFVAVTPDETLAVVANAMPVVPASDPGTSAAISLIDLGAGKNVADIRLPPNSGNLRQVAVSPDGKWAYVVHNLGRTTLPTTQLERGWINTNALSVIDLAEKKDYATVLLDQLSEGAADPWGCAVSADGKTLWLTIAGVGQIARLDLVPFHQLLAGETPKDVPDDELRKRGFPSAWLEIKKDPAKREALSYDLAAMYGSGVFKRIRISENGPRGIAISPDSKQIAVAAYFAGTVLLGDGQMGAALKVIPVGTQPEADLVRRGEMVFFDATNCFQHWLSCGTCHPEGRADGLNWDLLNDGIGNPKNGKSLLLSDKTPPAMSLGVRANMEVANTAGFRHILFREPDLKDLDAVHAYVRSMEPVVSPFRTAGGDLSEKAKKGKVIFESAKTACATCHPAGLFTDLKTYDVGTHGELDREANAFDTPTLIEVWRTAPYLHDGSAMTLKDVLTTHNPKDQHGKTSHLTPEEVEALVEYLKSL
jgi:mono/diheme cytochrome c family protein